MDQNPHVNPFAPAPAQDPAQDPAPALPLPPSTFLHSAHVRTSPLTRAEMEGVIHAKGSVLYNGRVINKLEHLPHEAELALGDPVREDAARHDIRNQMRRLSDQLEQLSAGPPPKAEPGHPRPTPTPTPSVDDEIREAHRKALLAGAPAPHEIPPAPAPAPQPAPPPAPETPPAPQDKPDKGGKK